MNIRPALPADAAAIATIYNHYVETTAISFEEEPVCAPDMASRIADVGAAGLPWIVLEVDGALAGYAYATKWRARRAYRFSVESTVYLAPGLGGRGYGVALYGALLERLRAIDCHSVIGGIAQPNVASVALHEKMGFRKVAHFAEVGFKFGHWIDVGYWELHLPLPHPAS